MKRLLSLMLTSALLLGSTAALAAEYKVEYTAGVAVYEDLLPVNVKFNGNPISQELPSVIKNERTLFPVRYLAEAMGADVIWNEMTSQVTINKDGNSIILTIGSNIANVNGVEKTVLDGVAPVLVNDVTLVPLRFVNEELGLNVDWDAANFTALVSEPGYQPPQSDNVAIADSPSTVYTNYNMSFEQMVNAQASRFTTINHGSGWVRASADEIRQYLDISNIAPGTEQYFQFLDLSKSCGIPAEQLNSVLNGRGILSGMGDAFVQGGATYGVNEAYLVSHAFLETGYGTSKLATGVQYNGTTVYNMFGIGAVDSDPIGAGARTAYENGWFTPYDAIVGGAKFVSEKYINRPGNRQNTVYKMRWNPDINQIWHQYATDVRWANAQVRNIKNIYDLCPNHILNFDVPVYQ
ncbi:MAG: stalk domain-containing protein [Andreesenia angusta]|nr:stalk domain-containing protein [Andreesenia angusta]